MCSILFLIAHKTETSETRILFPQKATSVVVWPGSDCSGLFVIFFICNAGMMISCVWQMKMIIKIQMRHTGPNPEKG